VERENSVKYGVSSIKDISIIIDHFNKYPLISKKKERTLSFSNKLLVSKKDHLTTEGFNKTLSIKAALNTGLNDGLKEVFGEVKPAAKSLKINQ